MGDKITKIEIITRPDKFEELKEAMNKIGINGMTVSNVLGCGQQKGHKEFYRGTVIEINLIHKIKVEIVVCDVPVESVLKTAQDILKTGNIGDGKIFVYELADAVRIRTGEEGCAAIRDSASPVNK